MTARRGGTVSTIVFGVVALLAAALCVRLGIWQLDRLAQRRSYNAQVAARFDAGPEPLREALARDTADARWRRVRGAGVPDYSRDILLASRTPRWVSRCVDRLATATARYRYARGAGAWVGLLAERS